MGPVDRRLCWIQTEIWMEGKGCTQIEVLLLMKLYSVREETMTELSISISTLLNSEIIQGFRNAFIRSWMRSLLSAM